MNRYSAKKIRNKDFSWKQILGENTNLIFGITEEEDIANVSSLVKEIVIDHQIPLGYIILNGSDLTFIMNLIGDNLSFGREKLRTGLLNKDDFSKLSDFSGLIYDAPLYIEDSIDKDISAIRTKCYQLVEKYQVKVIFVDCLEDISSEKKNINNLSQLIKMFEGVSKVKNVSLVLLSKETIVNDK